MGDKAIITLDAYGDDIKFNGKVTEIEKGETVIQDVVYYKVTITLDPTEQAIKPGMTANVKIVTAQKEDALSVPSRALIGNGHKTARVLENGELKEIPVETGLKADGGLIEIISGLEDGQEIVVSVKNTP